MDFYSTIPSLKIHTFHICILMLITIVALPHAGAQQPSDTSSSDNENPWTGNNNVSPSLGIIIIVLVLSFFITGCVSIYIQQCTSSSNSTTQWLTNVSRRGRSIIHGLDQSVIESFPTFEYSAVKELKIGKGALECAVCLNEFEDSETLRLLPKCDHVFHPGCVDVWLQSHTTCPVCRANLAHEPNNDDQHVDQVIEVAQPVSVPEPEPESMPEIFVTIHSGEGQSKKTQLERSHSTGHSLVQTNESCERFTLKLPAEVRKQLMARAKLKRATSLVVLPRQSSSRRGYRGGEGSGSSRYGRIFGRSFVGRLGSFRSTSKVGTDGEGSVGSRRCSGPVCTPMEGLPPLPV